MKLMTDEIEKKLDKFPMCSQDGKGMDAEVIVKFFNPCGAGTWLITEGEKQEDGEWVLFGYCCITDWEWGEVMLSELQDIRLPIPGLRIERDLHCEGKTVGELCR